MNSDCGWRGRRRGAACAVLFWLWACAAAASPVMETGGSDFVAIGVNPERLHEQGAWENSQVFRTPACQYDTQTAEVDRRLKQMREAGQKKLGLILWFSHLDSDQDCSGFLLNSAGNHLSPKVMANLQHLLQTAGALGFDEVQLRFAPMGKNWPEQWQQWQQDEFAENWAVISSTIAALSQVQGPRLVYDLGVELGGVQAPRCSQCEAYVRRLWSGYLKRFSPQDSYGFSVAVAPGRVERLLRDLRQAGSLPRELALDTYDPERPGIKVAAQEMRGAGANLPILIQETLYNDPEMYRAIIGQAQENHVRIRAIMQWPVARGVKAHISESETPAYAYSGND